MSSRTPDDLYTVNELAAKLKVHRNTIHALHRRGDLHAVRVGNRIRFRPADVMAYINRGDTNGDRT